jgi:hypothetical protein
MVVAVSEVPDVTGQKMAVGTGHRNSLKRMFHLQKGVAHRLGRSYSATLYSRINNCATRYSVLVFVDKVCPLFKVS